MSKKQILEKSDKNYTITIYKSIPKNTADIRYQFIMVNGEKVLQISNWMEREDFFAMCRLLFFGFSDLINNGIIRRLNNDYKTP